MAATAPRRARALLANLALAAAGLAAGTLMVELALRLHDPLGQRVWGDRIVLPTRVRHVTRNQANPRLDREIVLSKNSLGFRGPEPGRDFAGDLTLVAVGGSTTECLYLTDGRDWPQVVGRLLAERFSRVWVDNAGLDGHSTYGHLLLVRQRLRALRPKVVLFLVGLNDEGRGEMRHRERALLDDSQVPWTMRAARHSAIAATLLNLRRGWEARQLDLPLREVDLRAAPAFLPGGKHRRALLEEHRAYLPAYEQRLRELVRLCREGGMEPVFLTQPALYGPAVDDVTGVDLARVEIDRQRLVNGRAGWELLEAYNDTLRRLGGEQGVLVIDAARQLPKSSRLFYDFVHFTNDGAEALARVVARELCPLLAARFPAHVRRPCEDAGPPQG